MIAVKYMPDGDYYGLLRDIMQSGMQSHYPSDQRSRLIELLGEVAGIYPECTRADVELSNLTNGKA